MPNSPGKSRAASSPGSARSEYLFSSKPSQLFCAPFQIEPIQTGLPDLFGVSAAVEEP
jgi:hypothetical protein